MFTYIKTASSISVKNSFLEDLGISLNNPDGGAYDFAVFGSDVVLMVTTAHVIKYRIYYDSSTSSWVSSMDGSVSITNSSPGIGQYVKQYKNYLYVATTDQKVHVYDTTLAEITVFNFPSNVLYILGVTDDAAIIRTATGWYSATIDGGLTAIDDSQLPPNVASLRGHNHPQASVMIAYDITGPYIIYKVVTSPTISYETISNTPMFHFLTVDQAGRIYTLDSTNLKTSVYSIDGGLVMEDELSITAGSSVYSYGIDSTGACLTIYEDSGNHYGYRAEYFDGGYVQDVSLGVTAVSHDGPMSGYLWDMTVTWNHKAITKDGKIHLVSDWGAVTASSSGNYSRVWMNDRYILGKKSGAASLTIFTKTLGVVRDIELPNLFANDAKYMKVFLGDDNRLHAIIDNSTSWYYYLYKSFDTQANVLNSTKLQTNKLGVAFVKTGQIVVATAENSGYIVYSISSGVIKNQFTVSYPAAFIEDFDTDKPVVFAGVIGIAMGKYIVGSYGITGVNANDITIGVHLFEVTPSGNIENETTFNVVNLSGPPSSEIKPLIKDAAITSDYAYNIRSSSELADEITKYMGIIISGHTSDDITITQLVGTSSLFPIEGSTNAYGETMEMAIDRDAMPLISIQNVNNGAIYKLYIT